MTRSILANQSDEGERVVASLFVIRGNDQGVRWALDSPKVGIGRDPSNRIQLHDTEVSRLHAQIRQLDDSQHFALVDLGSSNGTYVNNRRVSKHELESGDEVRIGSTVMLYKGPDEDPDSKLVDHVDITQHRIGDDSRIVQSLSHEEGRWLESSDKEDKSAHRRNLEIMYRTALAVSHTLDIDQLLNRILHLIFEWVECDRGCIFLVDNDTHKLTPRVRRSREKLSPSHRISIPKTIIDYVRKHGKGVLTTNAKEDDRWNPAASILKQNVHEAICVPMQGRHNNMVGLIYIDTYTPPEYILTHGRTDKFHEEHLKLMIAIGHQAAMAVEDTCYYSELMQAERLAAIGQTIATLSHHIKNILQGIQGGSYLIDMGLAKHQQFLEKNQELLGEESESVTDAISNICTGWQMVEKNQHKISNLVLDMLTYSKEREPAREIADLNEQVADVCELMEARAKELGVKLSLQLDRSLPVLTFDPEGIHRAVLNIVTNALDACYEHKDETPVAPHVKVSTKFYEALRIASVIVEDNGIGIPEKDLDKIFVIFNSSKKGGRGTGLGLSVSNKIVQEHGGKILVKSELGRGSKFTLQLPAVAPSPQSNGSMGKSNAVPDQRSTDFSKFDPSGTASFDRPIFDLDVLDDMEERDPEETSHGNSKVNPFQDFEQ
ncbi:GAF sensor signal transduction histidine kinase [Planctomycetales bacterium 10988]|nr:GAF sensor signal transduction histidine kinase [Planctomycetales bacterium 10988]